MKNKLFLLLTILCLCTINSFASANEDLFAACKTGNLEGVKKAIAKLFIVHKHRIVSSKKSLFFILYYLFFAYSIVRFSALSCLSFFFVCIYKSKNVYTKSPCFIFELYHIIGANESLWKALFRFSNKNNSLIVFGHMVFYISQ